MPDQLNEILNRLKNHGEAPPEFLLSRIMSAPEKEDERENSFFTRFNNLKDFSIVPDILQLKKIEKLIEALHTPVRKIGLLTTLRRYRAVAAVLVLFITSLMLYKSNLFNTIAKKEVAIKPQGLPIATDTTTQTVIAKIDTAAVIRKSIYTDRNSIRKIAVTGFYSQKLKPPGENIVKFTDNDLLYTIINCNYNMLEPYLKKGAKKMVVSIDQYSAVTVSPKMLDFMKVMYKTNKKQKPSAKAKRAKATLNKWKKKDEKHFDAEPSKTALDIMDLTEFIIDKK